MGAAKIRVIDDIDVAGLGRCRLAAGDPLNKRAGGRLHRANENRQTENTLRDQRAVISRIDAA